MKERTRYNRQIEKQMFRRVENNRRINVRDYVMNRHVNKALSIPNGDKD